MCEYWFVVYLVGCGLAAVIKTTWMVAKGEPADRSLGALIVVLTAGLWPFFFVYGGIKQFTVRWD